MERKKLIWIGMTIGTILGSYIGGMMSDNMFSMTSVLMSTLFGAIGVYLAFKYGEY